MLRGGQCFRKAPGFGISSRQRAENRWILRSAEPFRLLRQFNRPRTVSDLRVRTGRQHPSQVVEEVRVAGLNGYRSLVVGNRLVHPTLLEEKEYPDHSGRLRGWD